MGKQLEEWCLRTGIRQKRHYIEQVSGHYFGGQIPLV